MANDMKCMALSSELQRQVEGVLNFSFPDNSSFTVLEHGTISTHARDGVGGDYFVEITKEGNVLETVSCSTRDLQCQNVFRKESAMNLDPKKVEEARRLICNNNIAPKKKPSPKATDV